MERCKGDFYVSLVRNVEYGSRFVSLCRWILLFLCGDVSEEITS